jgi:Zn-dependent protease/CBS domain-containing protein
MPVATPVQTRSDIEPQRRIEKAADPRNRVRGLRLGRIAGIPIHIDWSLLIVFALVTFTLGAGLFPAWHPEWSVAHVWLTALAAAVLFFSSVLVHELSHALVGRAHGTSVRRITLFVFGGLAELEDEPRIWRAELWIAVVGPLTSLALAILFPLLARALAGPIPIDAGSAMPIFARLGTLPTLLLWLGQVNLILGLFNLVPGFPLDGGRVLRAILWGITGNLRTATRWASGAGRAIAWALIGVGLAMILGARVPFFGSGPLAGLWIAFIGWFLNNAALMSYRQILVRDALHGLPIARLMQTGFDIVSPELPVPAFVEEHLLRSSQRVFPVLDAGALVGVVGLTDVRRLDRQEWERARVRDVMTPREKLRVAHPDDDALDTLATLGAGDINQLPVIEGENLRGLVRREDILKWLALQRPVAYAERAE